MTSDEEAQKELHRMLLAFMVSHRLYVAAKLGLADLVVEGGKTLEELAKITGAHFPSLERLLDDLVADGLFSKAEDSRLYLTPLSDLLRRDHPFSFRPMVLELAAPHTQMAWTELQHTIMTGKSAFERAHGVSMWEFHSSHPVVADNFNEFMVRWSRRRHQAIVAAYDFSEISTMVDVGGGIGGYIAHIAQSYPALRGILFDRPLLAPRANEYLTSRGVKDRVKFVGGSFFESVPKGADVYFLAHVLHDWPDIEARAILEKCRGAMNASSRLLVEEVLGVAGTGRSMLMMVNFGEAKNRTQDELLTLIQESGYKFVRVVPSVGDSTLLEARPE